MIKTNALLGGMLGLFLMVPTAYAQTTPVFEDFSSNTLGPNLTLLQGAVDTSGGNVVLPAGTWPSLTSVGTVDVNYHTIDFVAEVTVVNNPLQAWFGLGRGMDTPNPGDNFGNPASGPVAFIRHVTDFGVPGNNNFIDNLTLTTNDENNGGLTPGSGFGEILNQDFVGPGYGPYTLQIRYTASTGIAQFFADNVQFGPDVDVSTYDFAGQGRIFFAGVEGVVFDNFSISGACVDTDGDGFGSPGNASCPQAALDCDDADPSTFPGALESCDAVDNDCDGVVPADEVDVDGDAFLICENDCNDGNGGINPDAVELPGNVVDENCDGSLGACDPTAVYKNHGQFVRCVSHEVDTLIDGGFITDDEGNLLVKSAAQSDVGKP